MLSVKPDPLSISNFNHQKLPMQKTSQRPIEKPQVLRKWSPTTNLHDGLATKAGTFAGSNLWAFFTLMLAALLRVDGFFARIIHGNFKGYLAAHFHRAL